MEEKLTATQYMPHAFIPAQGHTAATALQDMKHMTQGRHVLKVSQAVVRCTVCDATCALHVLMDRLDVQSTSVRVLRA